MSQTIEVETGQIWQDNHVNRRDRKFKVEAVFGNTNEALVKSVAGTDRPKFTKIKLKRFTPRYYTLVKDTKAQKTTQVTQAAPVVNTPSPLPQVQTNSNLLVSCQNCMPKVTWAESSHTPNVVSATSGCFNLVVRSFGTNSYDIKIRMEGVILDTWVANHIDIAVVLSSLKDRIAEMTSDMSVFL